MQKFISNQQICLKVCSGNSEDISNYECLLSELLSPIQLVMGLLQHEEFTELPFPTELSFINVRHISAVSKLTPPVREGCLSSDDTQLH